MRGGREVLVRLSEADLGVVKPAAGAAGLKLDSFLVAATLRFLAIDSDFRRQFRAGRVSWGPQPARFAAAELVQIDLSEAQFAAIEKAAGGVRYNRSGQTVEVTEAQFIVGATTRLLEQHVKGAFKHLQADLSPFLAETLPPMPVLDEGPARMNERETAAIVASPRKTPPTVIVSGSMLDLPVVAVSHSGSRAGVWKAIPSPAPAEPPAKATHRRSAPPMTHPVDREEREEPANWKPGRSPLPGSRTQANDDREEDGAEDEPEELEPPPPAKGFDLKIGLAIGGVLVLSAVGTGVWATANRAAPAPKVAVRPPPSDELAELRPVLPGTLAAHAPSEAGPGGSPRVIERPKLPPPPDLPEPASDQNDPDLTGAYKALKELTRQFHQSTPSSDIDAILRKVYRRPRVLPDGKIVQNDDLRPEHRYDVFIDRAVAEVKDVYGVPPALVKAIIKRESNFDPNAKSPAGAVGLMQVMPFNAAKVNLTVADLSEPDTNILAGTRLIAVLLKYYAGDVTDALVAYNAKARPLFAPIPRNGETPGYVAAVLGYFDEFNRAPSSR